MKFAGLMLLFGGWIIVAGAIALLQATALGVFTLAGVAVQVLGMVLLFRAHLALRGQHR